MTVAIEYIYSKQQRSLVIDKPIIICKQPGCLNIRLAIAGDYGHLSSASR